MCLEKLIWENMLLYVPDHPVLLGGPVYPKFICLLQKWLVLVKEWFSVTQKTKVFLINFSSWDKILLGISRKICKF